MLEAAERRRRLVEDQHARLGQQRLGDLDQLPLRQRQLLHARAQPHVEPELGEHRPRPRRHRAREMNGPRVISRIVNRFASTSRSPNRLSSCETTATPRRTASAVVANRTGSPSSVQRRPRRARSPRRRSSPASTCRPVLAQQRVHRAGADREVRAGERHDAAVASCGGRGFEHSARRRRAQVARRGSTSCLSTSSLKYSDAGLRALLAREDLVDVVGVDRPARRSSTRPRAAACPRAWRRPSA